MLFSEEEKKQIAASIAAVEEKTASEIVILHADRSDDYAFIRGIASLVTALACTDVLAHFYPSLHVNGLLIVVALVTAALYLLTGRGAILRLLVPQEHRAQKATERAMRAFIEQGVTETRDRSGVLLFLSEAEHRVVMLADQGINQRVDPSEWQEDVAILVRALKANHAAEGVNEVVARIGQILADAFPPRPDDTNELSNVPKKVK